MYYIAGPIFNEGQKNVIKCIEDILDNRMQEYFSPREFGVIADEPMSPQRMERIFNMNIRMLDECDNMIAVLDDRDAGTIFEIGHFAAGLDPDYDMMRKGINRPGIDRPGIITFSNQGHGINVMLKHAVKFHCNGYTELEAAIDGVGNNSLEISE